MKKLVVVSIVAAMLLSAFAVVAMADVSNWTLTIKASDTAGGFSNTTRIGWKTTSSNATDPTLGEGNTPPDPFGGSSDAAAWSVMDGNVLSQYDFRQNWAVAENVTATTWTFKIFSRGGGAIDPIKVSVWDSATSGFAYDFPGAYFTISVQNAKAALTDAEYTNLEWRYDSASKLATTSTTGLAFYVPGGAAGTTMTITAVPEPSSMFAMASGLAGLAGFAIRRRRA